MSTYREHKGGVKAPNKDGGKEQKSISKDEKRELSQLEKSHAVKMKESWDTYFGQDPLLREMYGFGMIEGYRNIVTIEALDGGNT